MKMTVVVVLALVAAASAAAVPGEVKEVNILRSNYDHSPEGGYNFGFEADNGITRNENGELKPVVDSEGKTIMVVVVKGQYSYPGEDGKPVSINYEADEGGYRAFGDSIPTPAAT